VGGDIPTFVRTLLLNGYTIDSVQRSDAAQIFEVYRVDELGARVSYVFLIASDPSESVITPFVKRASQLGASPLGLGDFSTALFPVLSFQDFYHILGGAIDEAIVYDDELATKLDNLGHNRVPSGLSGKADDLLEDFTKQSLQFVTGRRSRRYGKERLFEPVPDGIVFEDLAVLVDSKAYSAGFKIEADDIKRFASYVRDFNNRYRNELGAIHSFVVVTGHFEQDTETVEGRRSELYAECQTQLTCLKASDLGEMVKQIRTAPGYRKSIAWKRLFSTLVLTPDLLRQEIERIRKDGVA
jgi:hypothetical protein